MAMPGGHSPSLVLTRDIPSGVRGTAKVGIACPCLGTDRVEEEATSSGGEHWAAHGVKRAVGLALTSVFCYGLAAGSVILETGGIASFFDFAHMIGAPSGHATGLLQMPPVRLVNR